MNLRDFKNWLKGYLAGCEVSSEEELTKDQLMKVIQMMELIVEEPKYHYYPSWGHYTVTDYLPSRWLSNAAGYAEKKIENAAEITAETREHLLNKLSSILNR